VRRLIIYLIAFSDQAPELTITINDLFVNTRVFTPEFEFYLLTGLETPLPDSIWDQLITELDLGDQTLLDAGMDIIVGPARPSMEDILAQLDLLAI
jgi:hypothetical protein